jgi:uncharacterized cysteine cluster protein YcgN (CxxCxxCC family)
MHKPVATFWRQRALTDFTPEEWESLCDGCAKCCLYKLEDVDSRAVYYTNVHCRLLDTDTGRCSDYPNRSARVSDCLTITPELLADPYWLPATCAYRLVAEGKDLPAWHPLVTGDPLSTARAGHSICGRTVCEDEADELENHLITWVR